jgi:hypothetical protein
MVRAGEKTSRRYSQIVVLKQGRSRRLMQSGVYRLPSQEKEEFVEQHSLKLPQ